MVAKNEDLSLHSLRDLMYSQVTALPETFIFCTKQGWNINRNLENSVFVKQIVSEECSLFIQRYFETPCIGIRQRSGENLGMVFVDLHCVLSDVRQSIQSQMTGSKLSRQNYWFLKHNTWPISCKQESQLKVIDIIEDSCLIVDVQTFLTPNSSPLTPSPQPRKKIKGTRHLSFRTSKDLDRNQIADSSMTDEKQILISYVRTDAAHHALILKQELSSLGFSVYLDVHEITSGVDWQDSLNDAVRNCQVFVPLVTPKYGETLWTNREIKLADVLGKYIIPVSFLSDWPPPCLAIQFSTTQYISWTTYNTGKNKDIFTWKSKDLKCVAKQIAEKVQKFMNTDTDLPSLIKRKTVVKSCPCVDSSNPQATIENREGNPLVVLCVHPQQSTLAVGMKELLAGHKFEVWCSTQLSMNYPDSLTDHENGIKPGTVELQNRQIFQEQADEAGVIVLILSQQFILSRTCQQQVFYCEQRKKLVPVLYGDFVIPGWLTVLTGHHVFMNANKYKNQLIGRVEELLVSTEYDRNTSLETCVTEIKSTVSSRLSVYITGSYSLITDMTEKICRSIGTCLASIDNILIGIGSGYGVEDMVAQSFYQESQRMWETNNKVLHIHTQNQLTELKNYGMTTQVRHEDFSAIVASVFDICIIIRGNLEISNLIDSFIWNEKVVIPVLCQDLGQMSRKPQDVSENDWSLLSSSLATPEQIGQVVKSVILQNSTERLSEQISSINVPSTSPNTALRKMTTVLLHEKI
ncbi:uncharacterized protein LOC134715430 isoform X1 [Mytilus trossulus]|uniref:uncharacterized protein LOC134715430 isoform X1 n=1 Tax=Mytilus trossulus TaxID=6551 RepID=UPI00300725E3